MGKPLMIQEHDDRKIDVLKRQLGARTKIDVVRAGLALLEQQVERTRRVERWRRAVQLVGATSREAIRDFQTSSRLKKLRR